ncbi:MAG: glycosyltransferase family 1 protein [Verrucomicrobia bacterium]|nr:glycosyltransferase family 1 protein [Verrucomicrobiota bacterium]
MESLLTFNVIPKLPGSLEALRELAYNMWWSWEPTARRLFRELDVELWERTNHNPVRVLQLCHQSRLIEMGSDERYLTELGRVYQAFQNYIARTDTYGALHAQEAIAYFSAEYGLHESFPNYSGGLGILSGDHCKSASDLGLNFRAVGLLYRDGYFKQQINKEGWQEAVQLNQVVNHLPLREVKIDDKPLRVSIELPGRLVLARVWELALGRIKIYLLDTMLPENSSADQLITSSLYGGNQELRMQQEMVLGIGGIRALKAIGFVPNVCHMNEGHSAFLSLERIRDLVEKNGINFDTALQVVAASNIFTTHTPVPAGNEVFSEELMKAYFEAYPGSVGLTWEQFMRLGQESIDPKALFSMTILALRTSRFSNAVSKLHGEVSRHLWQGVWKGVPVEEIPIISITNGVHAKTWAAGEFHNLYEKYLGKDWEDRQSDPDFWRGVIDIPDEVLWQLHQTLKQRSIEFMRERIRRQRIRNGETPDEVRHVNRILNTDVLTIGFARRFATYKRGSLLFSDPERLRRIVTNREHPVQFIFAGKAHPADEEGKKIIQEVYRYSRDPQFEGRIIFVEDYDINIGRRLYHGCDVWLNNPLRPYEASGTSGMKLPLNGGINLSVLDGWWLESFNGKNGWAIGADIIGGSNDYQNEVDIQSLFSVLENQIVPLYYAKPDGRLPLAWIQSMRESMRTIVPMFNTHRMVKEYDHFLYEPAAVAHGIMEKNDFQNARELSQWKKEMILLWPQVEVQEYQIISSEQQNAFFVGEEVTLKATVQLGAIKPEHVRVQAYFGPSEKNVIMSPQVQDIPNAIPLLEAGEGVYEYSGKIPAAESGSYGLRLRIIPTHPYMLQPHELRLITWN